jgi:CelD/BcsL family acetyltransferase involved in cellulose biosynthesis
MGRLCCTHLQQPDAINRLLPTFIEMHREQWRETPSVFAPFGGGVADDAFYAMVEEGGSRRAVILSSLNVDGEPIAMYFGFNRRCWYGAYRTTYRASAGRYSPGHLLLHGMIYDFRQFGLDELDLMRGDHAYKFDYASAVKFNVSLRLR